MLVPSTELEIVARHREVVRTTAVRRAHCGPERSGRALSAALAFAARVTGSLSQKLQRSADTMRGVRTVAVHSVVAGHGHVGTGPTGTAC